MNQWNRTLISELNLNCFLSSVLFIYFSEIWLPSSFPVSSSRMLKKYPLVVPNTYLDPIIRQGPHSFSIRATIHSQEFFALDYPFGRSLGILIFLGRAAV